MDGAHDLGGRDGFGRVDVEVDEPVFHHRWEATVLAANFAALGATSDEFRFAIEEMGSIEYLTTSYYEHWLVAIETLAKRRGLKLDRSSETAPNRHDPTATAARLERMARPWPTPPPVDGRFRVGDQIRTARFGHRGHTRLPAYLRDRTGAILAVRGRFRVPDESAAGRPDVTDVVYAVEFAAIELWGAESEPNETIAADLWERYLQ